MRRLGVPLLSCALATCSVCPAIVPGSDQPHADLEAFRRRLVDRIEASSCPNTCSEVEVSVAPGALRPESEGLRVLLIDEAILTAAATRYRSRTLAFLDLDEAGAYRAFTPRLTLSKDAYAVLKDIDEYPAHLDAEHLDMAQAFYAKFGRHLPPVWGHGMDILPFLADRIPNAQFVVSERQLHEPLRARDLCELLSARRRDVAFRHFDARVSAMEQSLKTIVETYGVNFVHLSWGLTSSGVQEEFQRSCHQPADGALVERILGRYLSLFSSLTALEVPVGGGQRPVLLFQAANASRRPLHENDSEELFDCAPLAHRIRVGPVAYTGTDVPPEGTHDAHLLDTVWQNASACTDVFIVLGYASDGPIGGNVRPQHFPSSFLGLGVNARPTWPPTSSFANPVALAHFIYLAALRPQDTSVEVTQSLTQDWTKPILDPLLYDQFPDHLSSATR